MILHINRFAKRAAYTIGRLYIDGDYFCDVLEDADRGLTDDMTLAEIQRRKVYGRTAIPTGTYTVIRTYSPKFASRTWARPYNGSIPILQNVKGFEGIRIHPLNTAEESYGCIGVGENKVVGKIVNSQKTFFALMDKYLVPALKRGERVIVKITKSYGC